MITVDWTRRVTNSILQSLAPEELDRLRTCLTPVQLQSGLILQEREAPIEHVYFVEQGLVALELDINGKVDIVQVGLVGAEGMIGLNALLMEQPWSVNRAVVQASGSGFRVSVSHMLGIMDRFPAFRAQLMRYVAAVVAQQSRTIACNGRHSIQKRCARWLLMAADRTEGNELPLRQTSLSHMLAVHRPGVSAAIRTLQQDKLIRQHRGRIVILDRAGLEQASCECYAKENHDFSRLFK